MLQDNGGINKTRSQRFRDSINCRWSWSWEVATFDPKSKTIHWPLLMSS